MSVFLVEFQDFKILDWLRRFSIQDFNFIELTQHITQTHDTLQNYAAKAINIGLTLRNYLIGYFIVEYEQQGEDRTTYGEHLLEKISISLA